jgi:pyruvate formate lyase activating enzyme
VNKGLIFDIRRFSTHDGPGIRTTVFFKGCPLKCRWCHNPESQVCHPELTTKSVTVNNLKIETEETTGTWMTAAEVLEIVEKDAVFYLESNGGVTLSGGEPLLQIGYAEELINLLKEKGFHVTVDTSGYAPKNSFERIGNADLFLFDIKLVDNNDHMEYTGVPNDLILNNLDWLLSRGKRTILRFPVIPGITDTRKNIIGLTALLRQVKEHIHEIDLLPYHSMAKHKYKRFGKENMLEALQEPGAEEMKELQKELEETGVIVKIGG